MAEVDVVVIDGHDYHTFQPLLYQVAADLLPQGTWRPARLLLLLPRPSPRPVAAGRDTGLGWAVVRLVDTAGRDGPASVTLSLLLIHRPERRFGIDRMGQRPS
jgi:hypothetical protein